MTNPLQALRTRTTRPRLRREDGSADIIVLLFTIPFILGLIFSLIDISSYFQTRSTVQNITRDGARQVALYGGSSSSIPLNTSGSDVNTSVYNKLYQNGACLPSNCSAPPTVECGPGMATDLNADAYCKVSYRYGSVGGGLVEWLGFGTLLSYPIETNESFKVETKY